MSLTDYEDFVYGACLPDINDPIGYWQNFSARQDKIVNLAERQKNHPCGGKRDRLAAEYRRTEF